MILRVVLRSCLHGVCVSGELELPGEMIEHESCVCVAKDSEGVDRASLVLKRASDAYGECRVGLTQV